MRHFSKTFSQITLFVALAGLYACGGSNSGTETDVTSLVNDSAAQVAKENITAVIKELPRPSEIPGLLEASGAEYDESLVNKANLVDNYLTTNTLAALNLGVYTTNLGYVVTYSKTQNALEYMKSVQKAVDKLGVSSAFDDATMKSFQNNLENKDSLIAIIDQSMRNADSYLRDNKRTAIAAMILAGSFVEGLYIATALVEKYPQNVPAEIKNQVVLKLIKVIIDQKEPLKEVIASVEAVEGDAKSVEVLNGLREIQAVYERLNFDERIEKNQGDMILTDKDLIDLTQKVAQVRTKIIQ